MSFKCELIHVRVTVVSSKHILLFHVSWLLINVEKPELITLYFVFTTNSTYFPQVSKLISPLQLQMTQLVQSMNMFMQTMRPSVNGAAQPSNVDTPDPPTTPPCQPLSSTSTPKPICSPPTTSPGASADDSSLIDRVGSPPTTNPGASAEDSSLINSSSTDKRTPGINIHVMLDYSILRVVDHWK